MPTLIVQMGHDGRPRYVGDRASVGTAGEQDFSRSVGAACVRLLDGRGGWRVVLIDADVDEPGETYHGDAFVAIHADGSTSAAVHGGSVGYQTPEGNALADAWQRAYDALGWNGGWQPDNYTENLHWYYGVRNAVAAGNRRAAILECGHLTNPDDRALMTGPGGPERVARALGRALGIPLDEEDDMPLNDADAEKVREHVWGFRPDAGGHMQAYVTETRGAVDRIEDKLDGLTGPEPIDYDQLAKALLRNMSGA
jgi:hypothetical protein